MKVFVFQGLPVYFWVGVVMCTRAVEHNEAAFSDFPVVVQC